MNRSGCNFDTSVVNLVSFENGWSTKTLLCKTLPCMSCSSFTKLKKPIEKSLYLKMDQFLPILFSRSKAVDTPVVVRVFILLSVLFLSSKIAR